MKKIVILALIVSLCNVIPANSFAEEAATAGNNPPVQETPDPHKLGAAPATTAVEAGIIGVAVSVLGLIALAASTDSGDATPAATSHPR